MLTSFAARLVDNGVGKYMMYFDAGVSSFFSYEGLTIKPFNLVSEVVNLHIFLLDTIFNIREFPFRFFSMHNKFLFKIVNKLRLGIGG